MCLESTERLLVSVTCFFLGGGRKGGKQNKGPKIKTSCFSGCSNVKKGSLHMNLYNRKYNLQGEFSGV